MTLDIAQLHDRIGTLPREHFAVLPTGLQPANRLRDQVRAGAFYVKRDDLTGIALGGNKSRMLEFVIGDAIAQGCDVFIAGGGSEQSNHAVQCVASANRVGLDSVMVLQRRSGSRSNGNALLHELLGGETVWVTTNPELRDRNSAVSHMYAQADRLMSEGRRPYVLESSLHPLSVIAYVNAVLELVDQLAPHERNPVRLYITSEGAALGGLLLGIGLLGLNWTVIGLDWRPQEQGTTEHLLEVISEAASRLGVSSPIEYESIDIRPTGGPAYGVGRRDSWAALSLAARWEGLLLDPVYTAKGLAGALADLEAAPPAPDEVVVFVHTGGVAALFAYEAEMRRCVMTRTPSDILASATSAGEAAEGKI